MDTTLMPTGRKKRSLRPPPVLASYSREASLLGLIAFIVVLFSILYPRSFCSLDTRK